MILVNERQTDEGLLVAACDQDVLGETFTDGNVSLEVTEDFYDGETVDPQTAVDALHRADIANLVGTTTVETAIDAGIVDEHAVLTVDDTLHAQLLQLG
jgi:hypothetical protein